MASRKTAKRRATNVKGLREEPYFIGLSDPVELRRHILEPTREVIQFLQSYEQFKKTKEEKTQAILQLKEDLRLIKIEINKLRKLLPKSKIKAEKTYRKIEKEIVKEQKAPKKIEVAPLPETRPRPLPSELDALEKELSDIERKLGRLSE